MPFIDQEVFRKPEVVSSYAQADYLEPAERTVIDLLLEKKPHFRMLDIAVGAGRTTTYFAPLANQYVGIDYSPEMIDVCQQRFGAQYSNGRFYVSDMRSLDWLEDNSFDFILISYNAISALQHEERLKVFRDLHRICSEGGYLYFSAHNLLSLHRLFSFPALLKQISFLHPQLAYWNIRKWWLRNIIHNPLVIYKQAMRNDYSMIVDGAEDFRLQMYYVKPLAQIKQLQNHFSAVRIFSQQGYEVWEKETLEKIDDGWLFYLAIK